MFKSPTSEQTEKYHNYSRTLSIGICPYFVGVFQPIFSRIKADLGQFAPVFVMRHLATDCLCIELGNCSGDWPWAWHIAVIDRVDGTHFGSCSTAENLFSDVEV
jgi:hypothetical protein